MGTLIKLVTLSIISGIAIAGIRASTYVASGQPMSFRPPLTIKTVSKETK